MKTNIIFTFILCFAVGCGPNIAYGDYVNSKGMSRKQIEAIKNHPRAQVGIASYYGKKFHKRSLQLMVKLLICTRLVQRISRILLGTKVKSHQS